MLQITNLDGRIIMNGKSLHLMIGAWVLMSAPVVFACRENIKFVNETGQTANDLHIKFNRGVDITDAGAFGDNSDEDGNSVHDLDGGTVNDPGSTEIDVTSSGNCQRIEIKKWWWTSGGDRIGVEHEGEPKAKMNAEDGPATGNGLIRVRIDGVDNFFNTMPGAMPAQTVANFKLFLSGIQDISAQPLIYQSDDLPQLVTFMGNVLGDPARQLDIELMNPDSSQALFVTLTSTTVPAVSEWGLLAFTLLVVSAGTVMVLRRQRRAAA